MKKLISLLVNLTKQKRYTYITPIPKLSEAEQLELKELKEKHRGWF